MLPARKHWQVAPPVPPEVALRLSRYSPIGIQILYQRNCTTEEEAFQYLNALPPPGASPWNLLGMEAAVDRVRQAIHKHEQIVIYGDYDADGVTATALLTLALQALGAEVRGHIPNRFEEGYGLNFDALDSLRAEGANLVITVDCGIRSPEEVEHAQQAGLDIIVTDHHHPGPALPPARAIINPRQPGNSYPDQNLAGVGLAYKLACALHEKHLQEPVGPGGLLEPDSLLDLVALGTITDLAPLTAENRSLVRAGMNRIKRQERLGVRSLMGVASLKPALLTAADVSFMLGPRLNAAGRIESALQALQLLLTNDEHEAGELAQILDDRNRERQRITLSIQQRAEEIIQNDDPDALLLFAADPAFNPGVVGLAASRLTEKYYRPAIVAHQGEEFTRASCRSIPELHITEALDECAELMVHHGGHAAAAGFTVRNQDLPALIERLKEISQHKLGGLDLRPTLKADAEVTLSDLDPRLWKSLEQMQPTGYGNPQASFVLRNLQPRWHGAVGKDQSHLKLKFSENGIFFDGIAFRQGHWVGQLPKYIDILCSLEANEYNGQSTLQLNIQDIKPAGSPD